MKVVGLPQPCPTLVVQRISGPQSFHIGSLTAEIAQRDEKPSVFHQKVVFGALDVHAFRHTKEFILYVRKTVIPNVK